MHCFPPLRRRLAPLLRLGLGGFFLAAGMFKLGHPADFARIIGDYGLVPSALLLPTAWGLILAEILAGGLTIAGRTGGLALTSAMLSLFIGILVYGLYLGLDVDCGCFGPGDPESLYHANMTFALWRDVAMLAAAGLIFRLERRDARIGATREPDPLP